MMPGTGISAPLANENLRRDLSSGRKIQRFFQKYFLKFKNISSSAFHFVVSFNKRHGEIQWVP